MLGTKVAAGSETILKMASTSFAIALVLVAGAGQAASPKVLSEQELLTKVARAVAPGPVQPTLDSLAQYPTPDWFRDAKLGIWSHWGPQSVPETGDWYARNIYMEGHPEYARHLEKYGHPSVSGYKDIIPLWKARRFEPELLMQKYKLAGARYFMTMGVHHDNFDLWNSTQHRWNAVRMGPKRDIVRDWQLAARKFGLRFAVSEHLAPSYSWFQTSHGSDKSGPFAGVPYDGADPRYADLYHPIDAPAFTDARSWYSGDAKWKLTWFSRIKELLDVYQPDMLYTDGGFPYGVVGRSLIADYFNSNIKRNGKLEAIYTCKDMGAGEFRKGSCLQDVERQGMHGISSLPWQTDTSMGDWFYNRAWKYTPTEDLVRFFIDIVSKNGNLLLNVVQRPDGDLDPEAESFLKQMAQWTAVNGEGIYGTRPWLTFGEGPALDDGVPAHTVKFGSQDIRYTQSKDGQHIFAFTLGWPSGPVTLESTVVKKVGANAKVTLLGAPDSIHFSVNDRKHLVIEPPRAKPTEHPGDLATAFKLEGFELDVATEAAARASNDSVVLEPTRAIVDSQQWNIGRVDDKPALVAWGDTVGSVQWLANFPAAGDYRVGVKLQAPDAPSSITLEIDGQPVRVDVARVTSAGKSDFLDAGSVGIQSPGIHRIVMRATNPTEYRRVHVFRIYLSPLRAGP